MGIIGSLNQPNPRWLIGVDVGGTTITTLLVDRAFQQHDQLTVATDVTSPDHTLAGIREAIEATLATAGGRLEDVAAVGLGIPGRVDRQTGVVTLAVNLNFYDVPIGPLLTDALGVPCFLENDVRVATLGVYRFANEESVENLAYVSLGTGLAAGLILNGQLYRGAHGMAGEIGHMVVVPDGPYCQCGAQGCLETLVAGPAIARLGQQAVRAGADTVLQGETSVTAKSVYQAAQAGDVVALNITEQIGRRLGQALQTLVMTFDVERIVIGGGVTRAGETFLQPLLRAWTRQHQHSALAQEMLKLDMLRLADPERNMGAWGAVTLAEQGLNRQRQQG